MELVSLKIIILTVSGVVRIIFGLFPLIIFRSFLRGTDKRGRIKKVISYLMFFGGGVLLATCLVHMMPEVRENFTEAKLSDHTSLPVAEIIFVGGFFLIYLLEDIIHGYVHRRRARRNEMKKQQQRELQETGGDAVGVQNHGFAYNVTPPSTVASPKEMFGHHLSGKRTEIPGLTPIPRVRSENNKMGISTIDPKFTYVDGDWWRENSNSQFNLLHSNPNLSVRSASMYDIPLNGGTTHGSKLNNQFANSTETKSSWVTDNGHEHSHDHDHSSSGHSHSHMPSPEEDESLAATFRNLLLIVAMSFHGIFEGMAIGLQGTQRDVLVFFLAVSLHECTILFCIGVELISSKTKILRMITYILVVSLVCPIGIAIGIVISENSFDAGSVERALVVGSLQGLAAGTLLYVTFFEIFAAEGRKLKNKYLHILVAVLGFAFMVFLEFVGGHSHSHSHGGGSGHSHGPADAARNLTIHDDDHDHDHGHAPNGHHHDVHVHDHDHGHDHAHAHAH